MPVTIERTWVTSVSAVAGRRARPRGRGATAAGIAASAVVALVAVAAVPVGEASAADPDLRARYDFAQGHAQDLSGNGHDGDAGSGVEFLPAGAHFDGSDDGEITVPYDLALQPEAIEPGERWRLELDDVAPEDVRGTHRAIIGGRAADDGWVVYITPTGTLEFWMAQHSGSARYARASSRVVAQTGRSYDIAVEWDGQVASIQVSDGGTGSGGTALSGGYLPAAVGHPVRFGNGGNTGSEFFFRGTVAGARVSVLPVEPQPTAEEVCGPGPASHVAPIEWAAFTGAVPDDEVSRDLAEVSLNATRYSLTTWYPAHYATQPHRYLDFGGNGEHQVRGPAMVAVGTAVPLALGTYDASAVGVSEEEAADRVARLAASLAYQHRANSPGGWGDAKTHWQTPLWSFYAGMAGWLVWDQLSPAEQACAENMVEYEAERIPEPAYYRDADGTIISGGNTQAEEDSAWASLLGLATAMMPAHESWQQWQQKNVEMLIAAYSRPTDTASAEELNGRALSEVLNGSNIENDGTVINHGFLHPIYMLAFDQSANTALTSSLAGQATPEAALHNIDVVYDALVDLDFAAPPFHEPGGTIYRPGAADVYYPKGNDWGTSFPLYFAQADVIADSLEQDGLVRTDAATWAELHTDAALAMQERHADGRTYASSTESNLYAAGGTHHPDRGAELPHALAGRPGRGAPDLSAVLHRRGRSRARRAGAAARLRCSPGCTSHRARDRRERDDGAGRPPARRGRQPRPRARRPHGSTSGR